MKNIGRETDGRRQIEPSVISPAVRPWRPTSDPQPQRKGSLTLEFHNLVLLRERNELRAEFHSELFRVAATRYRRAPKRASFESEACRIGVRGVVSSISQRKCPSLRADALSDLGLPGTVGPSDGRGARTCPPRRHLENRDWRD